jgi:ATPase subunit of ABC transporter with duplicated ATPase domains
MWAGDQKHIEVALTIAYTQWQLSDVIEFRREMAERDNRTKKEEAERKKEEEEEEQRRRDAKGMRSAEICQENRPQNLEDLMKLNLDKAPIKEIKAIMIKMGISPHDCFERADLKKKLIENVPELKFEMEASTDYISIDYGICKLKY